MKKAFLLLPCIFFLAVVSAQTINFDYPEEVPVGEEFEVSVELVDFAEEDYDVKIDIVEGEKRLSKILNNGEWKSTYYYIKEGIDDTKEDFKMKLVEDCSKGSITIKIRSASGDVKTFQDYEIKCEGSKENFEEEAESEDEEDEEKAIEVLEETAEETPEMQKTEIELNKVIMLAPKTIKREENKEEKRKINYALYGFIAFSVLIIILFVIKENQEKKNEFR